MYTSFLNVVASRFYFKCKILPFSQIAFAVINSALYCPRQQYFLTVESLTEGATSSFLLYCKLFSMNIKILARVILSCFFWTTLMFAFSVFTNALYYLLNLVIHFLWYFASHAIRYPPDNFAYSCVSPISVAAFRMFESRLRDVMW